MYSVQTPWFIWFKNYVITLSLCECCVSVVYVIYLLCIFHLRYVFSYNSCTILNLLISCDFFLQTVVCATANKKLSQRKIVHRCTFAGLRWRFVARWKTRFGHFFRCYFFTVRIQFGCVFDDAVVVGGRRFQPYTCAAMLKSSVNKLNKWEIEF